MDSGWGALVIIGLVIAAIIAAVMLVLNVLAWIFLMLSGLFGHPLLVIAALAAGGAAGGMILLHRRQGSYVPRSSHDHATIGNIKLTPEGWAALVLSVAVVSLALYGLVFVSSRAHRVAATAQMPAAFSVAKL
jgi:hypothetical protein